MIHNLRANFGFGLGLWVEICHMTPLIRKAAAGGEEEDGNNTVPPICLLAASGKASL
ncbi:GD15590 [Drosophila simulans]|uniref:GD15590 n=1 Tax=Drosophila simulans TaxID=7240 RepID=B4R7N9_DROSI|nr:GD15590 [Drosophila simulans]